jgi:N-acetylglutamate synthase-like GNAT family acetyltransferase
MRSFREGDEEKIVKLLIKVFGDWPHIDNNLSPLEFWRWKYLENPVHSSYVSVGLDDGQVISCQHNSIVRIKVRNEVIFGISGQDLAVHPDYRGLGLSSETINHANSQARQDGVTYSYFLTRNPVIMKRCESSENPENRRAKFPLQLVNYSLVFDLEKHLEYFHMKNPFLVKLGANIVRKWNIVTKSVTPSDDLVVEKVERFDHRVEDFLDSVHDDYHYIVVRDLEYLNWSYSYPGLGDYRKLVAKEDERVLGYAVLRANWYNREYPVGYIVDLMTMKHRKALVHLIDSAIKYFKKNNVNIVNFLTVKGNPFQDILQGFGFLDSRVKINMYIPTKEQHPAEDILYDRQVGAENVHIVWGDYDALPVVTQHYQ